MRNVLNYLYASGYWYAGKQDNPLRWYGIPWKDHLGSKKYDVYVGPEGVLTGVARAAREAKEKAAMAEGRQEIERAKRQLERKRQALEMQIATMRADFDGEEEEFRRMIAQQEDREKTLALMREEMVYVRKADRD